MSNTEQELERPPTHHETEPRERARSWFREHPIATVAALLVLVLTVLAGLWAWSYYSVRESTDDARADTHVAPVSARVAGHILEIFVDENDRVTAGQVLARIDDRDYQIALQRAQADLAAQRATARAARTQVPIASTSTASEVSAAGAGVAEAQAGVAAARQNVANAKARLVAAEASVRQAIAVRDRAVRDLERYKTLIARDEISRQQFDAAASAAQAAQAQVDSAQAAV
jgi:membrane fusion protein (multidrug efflux system)